MGPGSLLCKDSKCTVPDATTAAVAAMTTGPADPI